jgi:hypothetical protein
MSRSKFIPKASKVEHFLMLTVNYFLCDSRLICMFSLSTQSAGALPVNHKWAACVWHRRQALSPLSLSDTLLYLLLSFSRPSSPSFRDVNWWGPKKVQYFFAEKLHFIFYTSTNRCPSLWGIEKPPWSLWLNLCLKCTSWLRELTDHCVWGTEMR